MKIKLIKEEHNKGQQEEEEELETDPLSDLPNKKSHSCQNLCIVYCIFWLIYKKELYKN